MKSCILQPLQTTSHVVLQLKYCRNIPLGVMIAVLFTTTIYLLANISYFTVMSPDELLQSNAVAVASTYKYVSKYLHTRYHYTMVAEWDHLVVSSSLPLSYSSPSLDLQLLTSRPTTLDLSAPHYLAPCPSYLIPHSPLTCTLAPHGLAISLNNSQPRTF